MNSNVFASTVLAASLVAFGARASAQDLQPEAIAGQPFYGQPVVPAVQPVPAAAPPAAPHRGRFSVGRFFLESLVGGAIGAAAGYGVFRLACGNDLCLGGALGALGTNVVLTPLAVWTLGRVTGGEGSIGSAYLGGAIGLGAGGAGMAVSPGVSLAIGTALMPFTAALAYELNSNGQANAQEQAQGVRVQAVNVTPLAAPGTQLAGLSIDVSGRF